MGLPSFAVVIPMYNERAGAEACVRAVCGRLDGLPHRSVLIVVDDASRDGTGEILERLCGERPKLILVTHPVNLGYGAGLRSGAERARREQFDYVLFMDSDLTNDPADIEKFTVLMERGIDVIKATRYSRGGRVVGVPFRRVIVSRFGNRLARALFRLPVRDCTNGFRAVRTALLSGIHLRENTFAIIMEELYWLKFQARTYAEVPVTLVNRKSHQRPTSFVYRPAVFWQYLKYPLRAAARIRPDSYREAD